MGDLGLTGPQWTIEAWVYFPRLRATWQPIVGTMGKHNEPRGNFTLAINESFVVAGFGSELQMKGKETLRKRRWYHVAFR